MPSAQPPRPPSSESLPCQNASLRLAFGARQKVAMEPSPSDRLSDLLPHTFHHARHLHRAIRFTLSSLLRRRFDGLSFRRLVEGVQRLVSNLP